MLQVGVYPNILLAVIVLNWYIPLKEEEPVIHVDLLYEHLTTVLDRALALKSKFSWNTSIEPLSIWWRSKQNMLHHWMSWVYWRSSCDTMAWFLGGRMHDNNTSFVMENQQENFKYTPIYYFCNTTSFSGLKVDPTKSSWKDSVGGSGETEMGCHKLKNLLSSAAASSLQMMFLLSTSFWLFQYCKRNSKQTTLAQNE